MDKTFVLKEEKMKPKTFNDAIYKTSREVADLVISKQKDYGTKNILNAPFGVEQGILTRIYDKISRLTNLLKQSKVPKNESIDDSWKDIIGYSLIVLMVRRGWFELPLKKE